MPIYPGITTHELLKMLRNMSLEEILIVNRSYGPYFDALGNSIDNVKAKIAQCEEMLLSLDKEYKALEIEITVESTRRREVLSSLPGNGPERYLVLNSLSQPSLNESQQMKISERISAVKKELSTSKSALLNLEKDNTDSFDELKKVIAILDEKRKEQAPQQRLEASSPAGASLRQ